MMENAFKPGDRVRRVSVGFDQVLRGHEYDVETINIDITEMTLRDVDGYYSPSAFVLVTPASS